VVDHGHDDVAGDLALDALASGAALSRLRTHCVHSALASETWADTFWRRRLHGEARTLVQGIDPIPASAAQVGHPPLASFSRSGFGR